MRSREENLKTYDNYYTKPAWWFRLRYDTQVKRKTCLALLKVLGTSWPSKRIFELGYGSGEVLFSFPQSCEIFGAELSSSAVKQASERAAKKGYSKFRFFRVHQDKPLSLPDEFFDLAIASHVLEHVENDVSCMKDLYRILKVGGVLVVLVPINERFHDPRHVRQYTFDMCKKICEQNGFRFVHGFENELLSYLVGKLYRRYRDKKWSLVANIQRSIFNVLTAPFPFWLYRVLDVFLANITKLPPRQAALLFLKEPLSL